MVKIIRSMMLCLTFLLSSCTNSSVTVKDAEDIALKSVSDDKGKWYVSGTRSEKGEWMVTLQMIGDDCKEKIFYISKDDGEITDERGGNSC